MIEEKGVESRHFRDVGEVDEGMRTGIEVVVPPAAGEQFLCDYLAQDERVSSDTTLCEVEEPLDDDGGDLLAEGVVGASNGDAEIDLSDGVGHLKKSVGVAAHLDDLSAVVIDAVGDFRGLFAGAIGHVAEDLDDFVKGVFVVVPEDDAELVLHHGICGDLESEVSFIGGDEGLFGRVIERIKHEIEGIPYGTSHTVAKLRRDGDAVGIVFNGGYDGGGGAEG